MSIKSDVKKAFKKEPVIFTFIAIAIPLLLTLSSYTEQKPVVSTKSVAKVDCGIKPVIGRCILILAEVE